MSTNVGIGLQLVIAIALAILVMVRSGRPRPLNQLRIWLFPALLAVLASVEIVRGWAPHASHAPFALGILIGAAVGWWRGSHVKLTWSDPGWTIQTSRAGVIVILTLLAVRQVARVVIELQPDALSASKHVWLDALLLLGLTMVGAHRLRVVLACRAAEAIRA